MSVDLFGIIITFKLVKFKIKMLLNVLEKQVAFDTYIAKFW